MNKKFQRTIYTKQDAGAFFMLSLFAPQVIGLVVVIVLLFVSLFSGVLFSDITSNPVAVIFLALSTQGAFLLVFFLYNKILRFDVKKANKIYFKNGFKNIIVAIIIGLITLYGFQYIVSFFDQLITLWGLPRTDLPLPLDTWYWLVINIVLLAFVPAVCEELVFRGVIFNGLMQYTNIKEGKKRIWIAVVGSALLFALIHGSIEQTIYPIIFGIVLGILAYKTKSIVPGMVAHFVNNAFVLTMNFLYKTQGISDSINFTSDFNFYFWGTVIGLVAVLLIWLLSKLLTQNKNAHLPQTDPEIIVPEQMGEQILSEQIIVNHDIDALERARKQPNIFLWVGVGFGILFWIISLFN